MDLAIGYVLMILCKILIHGKANNRNKSNILTFKIGSCSLFIHLSNLHIITSLYTTHIEIVPCVVPKAPRN